MRPVLQKIVHKFLRGTGPHPNPKTAVTIIVLRGGRCLVSLPHLNAIISSCTAKKPTTTNTKNQKTPKPENERRRRKRKKKTGAGGDLGVGAGGDVRIGVGDRVQLEETQGEPQTPRRGFGFPQRLREREEETRRRRKQPDKREEEGHIQKPNTGRGLKGSKTIQYTNPRDKNAIQSTNDKTKTITEKQIEEPSTSPGICSLQGGGAHGPPCLLLRSHLGGP